MKDNSGNIRISSEMVKRFNLWIAQRTIRKIIRKSGVIKRGRKVEFKPYTKELTKACITFGVEEDDATFGEKIQIVIKPDNHTERRILRLLVQEGSDIVQVQENKDRPKESDKGVYKHEMAAIQADLKEHLEKYVKKR